MLYLKIDFSILLVVCPKFESSAPLQIGLELINFLIFRTFRPMYNCARMCYLILQNLQNNMPPIRTTWILTFLSSNFEDTQCRNFGKLSHFLGKISWKQRIYERRNYYRVNLTKKFSVRVNSSFFHTTLWCVLVFTICFWNNSVKLHDALMTTYCKTISRNKLKFLVLNLIIISLYNSKKVYFSLFISNHFAQTIRSHWAT